MQFHLIHTIDEAEALIEKLHRAEYVGVDTEYSSLDYRSAELISTVVSFDDDTSYSILPQHLFCLEILKEKQLIFQNFVVDHYILAKNGLNLMDTLFVDTMLMDHLIDETRTHNLEDMVFREFGDNYKSEFWAKYKSIEDAPLDERLEYEGKDAIYTRRLGIRFLDALVDRLDLVDHVHNLAKSLAQTEYRGIRVNTDLMIKTEADTRSQIQDTLPKLRSEFNEYCNLYEIQKWQQEIEKRKSLKGRLAVPRPKFSFESDSQVQWLVYEGMGCEVIEKTKKGSPSTSFDTLSKLASNDPRLAGIVQYKELKGVYATFMKGMLERVENGRIYPRFNINGTHTGRISHKDPNMGNMPKEGVIRNFFIPEPGNVIVGADYAQLEVVVEANLTKDKNLLSIILEGASKHDITAQGLGISRDAAKTLNFALQYGAGVRKVSKLLGVSDSEAQLVFNKYWELYSGVKRLKDVVNKLIDDGQPITSVFGRQRHFPRTFSDKWDLAKAQRQGYSALIQGTGADITNYATYKVADAFRASKIGFLWFSVHDEIVCETLQSEAERGKMILKECMEDANNVVNFEYPVASKPYGPLHCWSKA